MAGLQEQSSSRDLMMNFRFAMDSLPFNGPSNDRILRVNLNLRQLEAVPVFTAGTKRYFAGTGDTQGPTLTLLEDDDQSAHNWYLDWAEQVMDDDGLYGSPDDVKKDLIFFAEDAKGRVKSRYIALGCWPSGASPLAFDRGSSDKIVCEVTFQCDGVRRLK